ncbi:Arc family DNA-binding protein [Delftia deserti]|uniref:Arc family DNA-binding protein n=1 Tax=Delftia deserti TaxID=1651218 RepID=A0ABW5F4S6_9BURK
MARTDPQLNFRIPAELKERLETAAAENKRTLTAELVARLEASLNSEGGFDPQAALTQLLEAIAKLEGAKKK